MTHNYNLNAGQIAAGDDFLNFLFSTDTEHKVSGPGGTGKTYWMRFVIDILMQKYRDTCDMMGISPEYRDIYMTATTNKAADELAKSTGIPCSTIHSLLGLTVFDDYSTGKSTLRRTKQWRVIRNAIIFLDEAYMTDTTLLNEIRASTMKCKIVFVGDHCQLNPVFESVSPVHTSSSKTSHLTEMMRTNDPNLMALNAQLRETVETKVFKPIKIVPGVIDYLDDAQLEAEIAAKFTQPNREDRILAYTNKRVLAYNDHIRTLRGLPDEFTVGEILVNNSALQLRDGMIPVEGEVEILDIDPIIQVVSFSETAKMDVRVCSIMFRGEIYEGVKVPVNRTHYENLIKFFKSEKDWGTYYELQRSYADFRQRDACTTHKAQGSTHKSVIIDTGNISTCPNPDTVARLLYVCNSRAQQRVMFYGPLASKYGGFEF